MSGQHRYLRFWPLWSSVYGYLLLLVVLPMGSIIGASFSGGWREWVTELSQPPALAAIRLSVETALIAACINLVMGTLVAFALVRSQVPGRGMFNALVDIPLGLPTTVSGLMLLLVYSPDSWFGGLLQRMGVSVLFTPTAIVLAQVFVTFPLCVRAVQPLLAEQEKSMEEAARTLGAGPLRIVWQIILPAVKRGMVAGFGMTFARGMAEFGSAVLVAGNRPMHTEIAPVYLYGLIEQNDETGASMIALVLLLIALCMTVLQFLLTRSRSRRPSPRSAPSVNTLTAAERRPVDEAHTRMV